MYFGVLLLVFALWGLPIEIAKEKLQVGEGLGSYRVRLLDAISNLDRTSSGKIYKNSVR